MITTANVTEIVEVAAQIVFDYGSTDSEVVGDMFDTFDGNPGFTFDDLAEATRRVDQVRREIGDDWDAVVAETKKRVLGESIEVEVCVSNLESYSAMKYARKIGVGMRRGTGDPVASRWHLKGTAAKVAQFRKHFEYPS